jgi:hypothetical protein
MLVQSGGTVTSEEVGASPEKVTLNEPGSASDT